LPREVLVLIIAPTRPLVEFLLLLLGEAYEAITLNAVHPLGRGEEPNVLFASLAPHLLIEPRPRDHLDI